MVYFYFQLGPQNIRVGSISPGMTETDIVLATFPENPGLSDEMFSKYPSLKSADVADLVVALLAQPQRVQMQDLKVTHTLSK